VHARQHLVKVDDHVGTDRVDGAAHRAQPLAEAPDQRDVFADRAAQRGHRAAPPVHEEAGAVDPLDGRADLIEKKGGRLAVGVAPQQDERHAVAGRFEALLQRQRLGEMPAPFPLHDEKAP
jgi:hypothetical protein